MAYALTHNGGLSQANFWFINFGGDYPFINYAKNGSTWFASDNSVNIRPANFDSNGYAHTINNGGPKKTLRIPSQTDKPGDLIVKWDGGGGVAITGTGATKLSGDSTVGAGQSGRAVWTVNSTSPGVTVGSVATPGGGAGNYPTNIRVCHEDDEALMDAGEIFSPLLLSKLRNIGVLRFLDWQAANTSVLMRYEDQMTEDHHSYGAYFLDPSKYAGFTTNVGDAYAVGASGGVLVDGLQVLVTFNTTSSGFTPTFNWRNTGDISIRTTWGDTLFGGRIPTLNRNGLLTYNAAMNVWLKIGGDTQDFEAATGGVPISICLRLCAEVGAHPWFHIPPYAVDPMTNFTTDIATACKTFALANATWMKPLFEPLNEIWNSSPGFIGTRLAWNLEDVRIGSAGNFDHHNWYGRALSKIGQAVSAVYSGDTTKYDVYCGTQAFANPASCTARIESTRYVTETGDPDDAAYNHITCGGCTNYWLSSYTVAEAEVIASGYVAMTQAEKDVVVQEYVESEEGTAATGGYQTVIDRIELWNTWFQGYGTFPFRPYEGGYSVDPFLTGSADLDALQTDSYFSRSVYYLTQMQYNHIYYLGGEYPSLYLLAGDNIWSAHKPTLHSTPSSEWPAIVDYSDDKRRFRMQITLAPTSEVEPIIGMALGLQFGI